MGIENQKKKKKKRNPQKTKTTNPKKKKKKTNTRGSTTQLMKGERDTQQVKKGIRKRDNSCRRRVF